MASIVPGPYLPTDPPTKWSKLNPRWWKFRSLFLRSDDGREVRVVAVQPAKQWDPVQGVEYRGYAYHVSWPDQLAPQILYSWEVFDGTKWFEFRRVLPYWGPEKYQRYKRSINGKWYPQITIRDLKDSDLGRMIELDKTYSAPFYVGRIQLLNQFSTYWGRTDLALTSLGGSYSKDSWPNDTPCIVYDAEPQP